MTRAVISSVRARLLVVPLPAAMRYFGYDSISVPFVEVVDADGRRGTGFSYTLDAGASVVCDMVRAVVGPALVGRTVDDWGAVRADVLATTRRLGATTFVAAVSAVDIAVWDLRAQAVGVPLAELLGAGDRQVPFYGSGRSGQRMTIDELVQHSLDYVDEGFDGVKVAIGALPPEADLERVDAVRDAVGANARVMVDASERLVLAEALWLGERLDDLDIHWFEEPMPAERVADYGVLSRAIRTPVATGEHFQQVEAFERYLAETATVFYQPDAALGGGITAMLEVARAVELAERPIAWHSLADLHVHLAASTPASVYVEDFPILANIIAEPLRPVNGVAAVPARPGHGIRWDDDAIDAFAVDLDRRAGQ